MNEQVFAYSIDADDKVISVSDSWLEFAQENRAHDLTRDRVVGESLWRFVADRETRLLYEDIFLKVRTRSETIELPFRCDSPDRFRFMRLLISPGPERSVECRGILVREQKRPDFSILDRAFPRSEASLSMCSLCMKIYAFDTEWLELEDAIRELDLFDSASLPKLRYAVCDACRSKARNTNGGPDAAS